MQRDPQPGPQTAPQERRAVTEPEAASHPEAAWYQVDPSPVLLVGPDAVLLGANPAGSRLLASGALASVRSGRLAFGDADARRNFQSRLREVLKRRTEHALLIVRGDDGVWRRLELCFCPDHDRRAAFLLSPADRHSPPDLAILAEAFGLSTGESRVLHHLVQGAEPKRIAVQLGVSTSTVRNHLRSLYIKMHVRNLHGLIRRCIRLTS